MSTQTLNSIRCLGFTNDIRETCFRHTDDQICEIDISNMFIEHHWYLPSTTIIDARMPIPYVCENL